ncbi:MAG: thymidine phosphorylase [Verrucomicrobia bacterium]|nr:thymidine phosphorylase [Verrucomicrobiota bacterium]
MNFLSLLESKREGQTLAPEQVQEIIAAYTAGRIPDYQMAALLMAIFFRGLNPDETRAWTLAMRDSGDILQFPKDSRPLADKHSTGGVGDKVSLPLVPLLACLGFRVPMISGRGLGLTGGTLDKLESIPGLTTALAPDRLVRQVQEIGCAMGGQTERMVPADKRLYALRDVTATVPSIPLIVASILSKKLAENLDALVLDVTFGAAAFMRTADQARDLAQAMVSLGRQCGVNTRALLTGMDTPLGRAAGNWLEIRESVACLEGRGPSDLEQLVLECAAHLLVQTGREADPRSCLASGQPRRKWDEMLAAQGADLRAFERKLALDHTAPGLVEVKADRGGFVNHCDARIIGELVRDLGGGRLTKETIIHPEVGVDRLAKPGEPVQAGALLGRLHAADQAQAEAAASRLRAAFTMADEPPKLEPLVVEIIC